MAKHHGWKFLREWCIWAYSSRRNVQNDQQGSGKSLEIISSVSQGKQREKPGNWSRLLTFKSCHNSILPRRLPPPKVQLPTSKHYHHLKYLKSSWILIHPTICNRTKTFNINKTIMCSFATSFMNFTNIHSAPILFQLRHCILGLKC